MQRATGFFLVLFGLSSLSSCAQGSSNCSPPDHRPWSELLAAHVSSEGWVSYKGFVEDSVKLNQYLQTLSACAPTANWANEEKLAYWINAYNAFTVKLIVDHYPVASIKDIKKGIPFINSVWDIKFFEIGGKEMDLNEIEHSILRKEFKEPRIHFAIVCASRSCPTLRNEAFVAEKLDLQLQDQAVLFINDRTKNKLETDQIQLSSIFKWFSGDFTANGTIQEFVSRFAHRAFKNSAKVNYLDYDWSLNGE